MTAVTEGFGGSRMDWLRRLWAHRKLRKGKCLWCGAILPDDATARYCGPRCKEELDFLEAPIL